MSELILFDMFIFISVGPHDSGFTPYPPVNILRKKCKAVFLLFQDSMKMHFETCKLYSC